MRSSTTSWAVVGLGVIVSIVGWTMTGRFADGLLGFGLAHIVLGLLDLARPSVKV